MRMTPTHLPTHASGERGSIVIEAMLSIVIFSIAVIGMVGLQARMVAESIHAQYRIDATYFAQQAAAQTMVGIFDGSPGGAWNTAIQAALPNGVGTAVLAGTQFTVTVNWRMPQEPVSETHNVTIVSQICGDPNVTTC